MENLKQNVGQRIRAYRRALGWSQEELASRTGRSVYTLSLLERGVNLPNLVTLVDIATALKCKLDDLVDPSINEKSHPKSQEHQRIEAQLYVDIASMNLKAIKATQGAVKAIIEAQN